MSMSPIDDSLPIIMAEAPEPLLLLGAGNRITAANVPALALTGYGQPALVGAPLQDVLPAATDEGRLLLDEHLAAAGAGACRQFAWQLQDAGGKSTAVVVTVAPFEDENLLVSLQPAQSKAMSPSPDESLLDSLPVAAFATDVVGIITYANAAWRELLGTLPGESTHRHLLDFVSRADRERVAAFLHQAAIGAEERLAGHFVFRSVQGPISCMLHAAPLRDDDGAFLGISGTLQELHEQMRLEEEMRLLREANAALTAQIPGEEALFQQARRLSLMSELARAIAAGSDLDALSAWLVAELNATLGSHAAQLWRHDSGRDLLVLVAAAGPPGEAQPQPGLAVPAALGIAGAAVARGQTFVVDGPNELLLPDTATAVAVPVITGDRILGALELQSATAGAFGDDVLLLLEALGSQFAVALESSRLRAEMGEQLQELAHLQRLTTREAWVRYRSERAAETPGYRFDQRDLAPLPQGPETVRAEDNGSAVHLPLFVRGERIGALGVVQDETNPLSDEEQRLLEVFSAEVAEALDNARLLEQTQKRAVELETVSRVSAATSTILETDQLLQAVVELTKRSFGLYHVHIYILEPERAALVLAAGAGTAGELMVAQGWQIPVDHKESVVARAARERTGQIVNDVLFERGFLANPLLPETRAELAVPMIVGNQLVGVLDVQADRPNAFSEEDAQIQAALANQIASALQNATLYQEQLSTAEQLREFDRLKSEFLASMSHELRTPLNSIIGFADVLLEGIDGELNERMEEDVRLIRNSGEHLRNLIGDILDMSKIEAGMMDLRYEAINVPALEPEIRAFARTQMMTYDRDLTFALEISPEIDVVYADRTRLKQVLFNLLSNAIKFTNEGRVGLRISLDGEQFRVAVEDSGIGIDEKNVPIVFEQFRQIDGSLTRTAGGTGLGLPISKSLVEMHGGKIWVESAVGQGTTFFFTMPVKPPAPPPRRRGTGPLPLIES